MLEVGASGLDVVVFISSFLGIDFLRGRRDLCYKKIF